MVLGKTAQEYHLWGEPPLPRGQGRGRDLELASAIAMCDCGEVGWQGRHAEGLLL